MDVRIVPYTRHLEDAWDQFVAGSKNGTFMLQRSFVEYHEARFTDASLLAFSGERLIGVLPADVVHGETGSRLRSHGGLTYGGWVTDEKMTLPTMLVVFDAMDEHLADRGVVSVTYKMVPRVYHRLPADEDEYALFRRGAIKTKHDVSSVVTIQAGIRPSSGRLDGLRRARRASLSFTESDDWDAFFALLSQVLRERHGTVPTHTLSEMLLLRSRFPAHIKLYGAHAADSAMLAGAVVFDCGAAVHTQYLACGDDGRRVGALDLVISRLIADVYADRAYLSFGISTESGGRHLNEGLVRQKEMFGGRSVTVATYEYSLKRGQSSTP
ncbi:Acetyltransferase (GNAT) domain-containing protein [Quadrisphaera granulorum]|uniref:Acetyltransferase (GNAT) family protein n=1 Tax=Quadrisphaera granulorum TaxID=317664 RepID=A0A316A3P7_9ACTN|nr:GNAT family N-acetyltransferase [Quadrisphaera granulorum]PWJ52606.1 acetyltransferase (GNAT) family protein [Quadrisphaera granulorum]SZE97656.1 Acetyltransferase (GNAT) domain-containing protein [Quadrisphaera granulorum]